MQNTVALSVALVFIVQLVAATERVKLHRSRREASFTCEDSETLVRTPYVYESNVACKDVIGRPPDRYKDVYRKTCQRWLGLSELPESIADNYVDECHEYSGNSVKYKSRVCCFGTASPRRCFTCQNATSTYDCTYKGDVVTCPVGQVCMTQSKYYRHNAYSRGYRSAQCAPSDQCSAMEKRNSKMCQHYLPSPSCTYCCTGQFCNYMLSNRYLWAYDDACKRHPCYNGGTCVLNTTLSAGYYCLCKTGYSGFQCQTRDVKLTCYNGGRVLYSGDQPKCYCPISKTGKQCEQNATFCPSSANYPCFNGGTCYNHTASGSGWRCLCAPGWVGAHCEQEAKLECTASNGYFKYSYSFTSVSSSYNKYNCTYRKAYIEKNYQKFYTSTCKNHMRRSGVKIFREGVNGLVGKLEAISLYMCNIGEGVMQSQLHMCCPSCYSNPCVNGGWCQQNSEWDYVCQCRYGYEGRNCENKINMCIISGDPHYKTIDGKQIHFQGPCKYNLLSRSQANNGLPDFSIFGKNERRGSNKHVTYPSYFEIHYMSYLIKLKRDGVVTVNDERVYPDRSFGSHFKITKNGQFTRFESSEGLIVDFDGFWIALIKVPDSFREKVDGLCGNYDGDADNDMMTSSKKATTNYAEIGNSWQVSDPDSPKCAGPTDDNPPQCNKQGESLVRSNEYCGLLQDSSGVFGTCLKRSGQLASGFYESCKYDVCANQANQTAAKEAACSTLATVAAHCQSIKLPVLWRTVAKCPLTCPKGMTFKEKTSACAATCETPDGPEKCSYPDTENCVCPDDMVVINGTCQKPEVCRCSGRYKIDSSWLSTDCTTRYECKACEECGKRKVAKIYKYKHSCKDTEVCQKVDNVGKCQTCSAAASWTSWSEWSACNKTTQIQTRHRSCKKPKCGEAKCSGSSSDSQKCIPEPTRPNVPVPPSCAPHFDFQKACDECSLYRNPNMFIANPCSCATYYQCSKNQILDKYYDVYERHCGPCTCWNHDKLTCDFDPEKHNPDHEKCKAALPKEYKVEFSGVYCTFSGTRFEAIPSDPLHYINRDAGDLKMPCPPGTVFSVEDCQCIHGDNKLEVNPVMCLDFNDKEYPLKTNQGIYVSWSTFTKSVLEKGIEGTALRFNGGRLEIPYYSNKEMNKLTVSLWYKRDPGHNGQQALVSNDDCKGSGEPSILINTKPDSVGGGLRTNYNKLNAFIDIVSASNKWHHVVMTYDGSRLTFYLDGVNKGSTSLSGFTSRVACPLLIGSMYDREYFYGLMDKVCIFEESLSASQVKKLSVPSA